MITISVLMTQGLIPQLKSHIALGKDNGITKEEVVEIVTQLVFIQAVLKHGAYFQ